MKVGGRYRVHPIGVVEVNAVDSVTLAEISEAEAQAGGFQSRDELLAYMAPVAKKPLTPTTPLFRVGFVHGGDGDRVSIALETELSPEALADLEKRLARLEREGPWVKKVMALIDKHPRVAASQLAKKLKRETDPFKIDVRKLKKLGLTQSFEVGYEVSPRGRKFLELTSKPRKKSPSPRLSPRSRREREQLRSPSRSPRSRRERE